MSPDFSNPVGLLIYVVIILLGILACIDMLGMAYGALYRWIENKKGDSNER